jgi:hypothetical protein
VALGGVALDVKGWQVYTTTSSFLLLLLKCGKCDTTGAAIHLHLKLIPPPLNSRKTTTFNQEEAWNLNRAKQLLVDQSETTTSENQDN